MRAVLSRQNSARNSPMVSGKHSTLAAAGSGPGSGSINVNSSAKEEGRVDVGGVQVFKLETVAACQLITYIYEAKVRSFFFFLLQLLQYHLIHIVVTCVQIKDALENVSEINFFECVPLLEYAKNVSTFVLKYPDAYIILLDFLHCKIESS